MGRMRIDEQNRWSCIGLLVLLAVLAAVAIWLFAREPTVPSGNAVQGDIDGPAAPQPAAPAPAPAGTG